MSQPPSDKDRDEWGVVQRLHVKADTATALKAVCEIAFTEHNSGAASYAVKDGWLHLYWSDADGTKLPFRIKTPQALFEFVSNWLEQADFNDDQPDTDGSTKRGFCAKNDYGYTMLKIKPEWIIYGK